MMRKQFTEADQTAFARLSGDHNPMHLDAVAARRTVAAEPVVHGMHLLCWALDAFAASERALPPAVGLRAKFSKFTPVGDTVEVTVGKRSEKSVQLRVGGSGIPRADLTILFESADDSAVPLLPADLDIIPAPVKALDTDAEAYAGTRGLLRFEGSPEDYARRFPAAAAWIGGARLAAIGASTLLVGMICPGLHSIYAGLRVAFVEDPDAEAGLRFEAGVPTHTLITSTLDGGGIRGTLDSLVRHAPTAQPTMAELAGLVAPDAFAGSTALVIGGSRGLGELTAKLIASGGGKVLISYRVGKTEAEAVAADIIGSGGQCEILPYDVLAEAGPQIADLPEPPTHAYYFAAPTIARPNSVFYDRTRLDDQARIFVDGFWSLATALRERRRDIRLFYPSTVFITDRPKGMGEYAMAKAIGEVLCAEMNATMAPLNVTYARLPRLATDQTAGVMPADAGPSIEALLPLIRQVQGADVAAAA